MGDVAHLQTRTLLRRVARPVFLASLLACGDAASTEPVVVKPIQPPATAIALMTPFDSITPLERAADDSAPSALSVELRDGTGQAVRQAGRTLTLSVLEASGVVSTRIQIRRGATAQTDANGLAQVTGLVLSGQAGSAVLAARIDSLPAIRIPMRVKAGALSAGASAVRVSPDTVPIGGVAQVIVVPMDASGNKRGPGQQVAATLDGNQSLATVSVFTYSAADSAYTGTIAVLGAAPPRALRTNVNGTTLTMAPLFTGIVGVTPPAPATALRLATLPGDTVPAYRTLNGAIWPPTVVQLVDATGAAVRQAGVAVTPRATTVGGLALPNSTLNGGAPVSTDASGRATFGGLALTAPIGLARLRFEAANLTLASMPVQLVPGALSATVSTLTTSGTMVVVDSSISIIVTPRDAAGSALGSGQTVILGVSSGTSAGLLSAVTYNVADSSYRATFTGKTTGTPTTLRATVNGSQLFASIALTVIVAPGVPVAASPVTVTPDTIAVGIASQLTTTPIDGAGRKIGPGLTVVVTLGGGTSVATVGAITYSAGDSSYRATITGVTAGTTTSVTTSVNGVILSATRSLTVTAAPPPPPNPATNMLITVLPGDTTAGGILVQSGALFNSVTVSLRSASGAAVAQAGVAITATAVTSGGAVWSGASVQGGGPLLTGADGTVAFPALRLLALVGSGRLRFSATGLTAASLPVRVTAGAFSSSVSTFTLTLDTVIVSAGSTAIVTPRDAQGNKLGSGQTVTFALGATGTSGVTIGATSFTSTDSTYRATLTGSTAGTSRTVTASVAGTAVTTTRPLTVTSAVAADITATVNGGTTFAISRFIYGGNFINQGWDGGATPPEMTFNRLGGNRATAYNWETNYSNAGADYFHHNDQLYSSSTTPGDGVAINADPTFARGQAFMATIPMLGYVSGDACNCDVGVTDADRANRLATRFKVSKAVKGSAFTLTPNQTDATVYQDEFANWFESRYPGRTTNATAPVFFSLDNEPDIWHVTHDEIQSNIGDNPNTPRLQTYTGFTDTSVVYAKAIKAVLPNAMIFGPATATYTGIALLGRYPTPDPVYGTQNFFDVYLDRMNAAGTAAGKRLLDVLDLHFYPQNGTGNGSITNDYATQDAAMIQARVQAPRSLWDPTYDDGSWVVSAAGGPIRLIPRIRDQIAAHYPGTKIAVTEYNYGRGGDISGGVAQADVLGIFGREGVFAASLWPLGAGAYGGSGAVAYAYMFGAFKIFRNYDGAGSAFGDTGLNATTSDATLSSVYASRTSSGKTVLVVINKATTAKVLRITLTGVGSPTVAQVYVLKSGNANPTRGTDVTVSGGAISYTMPALSVTTLALTP